ncbi:sensor histidine kinase [Hymenobacter cavernae]|uniref:histidine kinase n=1 Tax=Hymenobacter cavernae TaxID=2044852 RepID=A0ABQ1U159_9BACT|nr:HAMP domain-containing sensor histidine kinase [Hymenobacter cavernae]GGF08709.1 two-component sensor histidine kinase [Hymenobacter cavernae]
MLIRNKLILRFTLLVVAIQLCLSAFVYYYSALSREQRYYHRLEAKAILVGSILIKRGNLAENKLRNFHRKDLLTMHDERISIYDQTGRVLYTTAPGSQSALDPVYFAVIKNNKPAHFRQGPLETAGILYQHKGQSYQIFVSGRDEFGNREFEKLRLILLVGNLGTLVLIILAGWYFVEQSLQPISRIVTEVEGITARNLSLRVHEGNRRDEIARLAITFNQMLSGLELAFESQKSFLSHASHELRTPLANLLGTLETSAAYDTDLAEAKQSINSAIEEIRHVIELTNGLLALAKADDTSFRRVPVRFDECVTQAINTCSTKHPQQSIRLDFGFLPESVEDMFMVRGNAQLLTTAVLNLLDNACKYSQAAVRVTLGYSTPQQLLLQIMDTGLGMSEEELRRIFEPLYRGQNGKNTPGYGLGLPITRKIIQLHAGQLLMESKPGEGTTATVRLPAAVEN